MKATKHNSTSRRALLAISTAAVAVAVAPANAADSHVDTELLALWRQWRKIDDGALAMHLELDRIHDTIPEDMLAPAGVQYGRVQHGDNRTPLLAHSAGEIDKIVDEEFATRLQTFRPRGPVLEQARETAERRRLDLKRRFAEQRAAVIRMEESSGLTAAFERLEQINGAADAVLVKIKAVPVRGLVGAAIKLHIALRWSNNSDMLEDYPTVFYVNAVRDLLPHLPADLAASFRPLTDGTARTIGHWLYPERAAKAGKGGAV